MVTYFYLISVTKKHRKMKNYNGSFPCELST